MKPQVLLTTMLLVFSAGMLCAQTSTVRVAVATVDKLDVTDGASNQISLDAVTPGDGALTGTDDTSGTDYVKYVHNLPGGGTKKISASAASPAGTHDITLKVTVGGGANGTSEGEITLITDGTTEGAKAVVTAIGRGGSGQMDIDYHASATAELSDPGNFDITVTFTSATE